MRKTTGCRVTDGYLLYENRLRSEAEDQGCSEGQIKACVEALQSFYDAIDTDPATNQKYRHLRAHPPVIYRAASRRWRQHGQGRGCTEEEGRSSHRLTQTEHVCRESQGHRESVLRATRSMQAAMM